MLGVAFTIFAAAFVAQLIFKKLGAVNCAENRPSSGDSPNPVVGVEPSATGPDLWADRLDGCFTGPWVDDQSQTPVARHVDRVLRGVA